MSYENELEALLRKLYNFLTYRNTLEIIVWGVFFALMLYLGSGTVRNIVTILRKPKATVVQQVTKEKPKKLKGKIIFDLDTGKTQPLEEYEPKVKPKKKEKVYKSVP